MSSEYLVPEVNIGLVGHVDHGKTSLTQALTGQWTDTHSEEMKRGITIRLGYADATFYYCDACKKYGLSVKCTSCFGDAKAKRAVSFVDAPGHETLMATVLSGSALMDGALLLIAADETVPQPQTAEHLKILDVVGITRIVIVQNKVDLVTEEQAMKNYQQIKQFVKGTVAENAPIIPVSAVHHANIDLLIEAIEQTITTPKRDTATSPLFYIARSFDVNKPGTEIPKLQGAVFGGSVIRGMFHANDKIEIKPGAKVHDKWTSLTTTVVDIVKSKQHVSEAGPGGLTAFQTNLDPALSRSDSLTGNVVGKEGTLPPVVEVLKLKVEFFDHVIGVEGNKPIERLKQNDTLMITVSITKTVGIVTSIGKAVEVRLKLPVVTQKDDKVALSKQMGGRWHLIGYGIVE
ncbi:MAG: translation initiation factor IF-2 subunit gamma [Candidatus Aenigmarchaeota archaeon]|nr:translation initiation factor IF-2 subunit gamma [Candidatus Aenigmarchaeota archaeon]